MSMKELFAKKAKKDAGAKSALETVDEKQVLLF